MALQKRIMWISCMVLHGLSKKRPKTIKARENINLYFIHTQMPEILLF